MVRKAKIVGTLGPSTDPRGVLSRMLDAGLDAVRLNFSHGAAADHRARVEGLRAAERRAGKPVGVVADLQGPRFRVGTFAGGTCTIATGDDVVLRAGSKTAPPGVIPVPYAALAREVRRGGRILMDDGNLALRVRSIRGDDVRCTVERGGELTDRKGMNLPGAKLSVPALTPKDRKDLRLAVELGADWLALSFVRRASDLKLVRRLLDRAGSDMPVLAKIERPEAIDDLDAILREADGLLVARGDLGVEYEPEYVPLLQKQIIAAANAAGKPVMTATQMLESMRYARRPTRAEASDVANAVLDGSGSLLLTAETAVGRYPVDAIAMMDRIVRSAESSMGRSTRRAHEGTLPVDLGTAQAACIAASDVEARYIAAFTVSGATAAKVARFRPEPPVLAFTPEESSARRMSLVWGVTASTMPEKDAARDLILHVDRSLRRRKLAKADDLIVVIAGYPIGLSGSTNFVMIHRIGDRSVLVERKPGT